MNGFNRCCGGKKGQVGGCSSPVQTLPAQVKPVCKTGHHSVHGFQQGPEQWDSISRVQEAAVECVQEFHHYSKVEHVIRVHVRNIHHQHTQHDYIIQQAETTNETLCYEYGLECEKDVCELIAQCGCK